MADATKKMTLRDFRKLYEAGERLVTLTAYDALTGRLADEAGVHLLLVGDSVGMTMLGYENTLRVTLRESLHHTAAVVRGVKHALVIGDMPFLSYQVNQDEAVRNAGRYLQEAGADGVKIEGGRAMVPLVERLVGTGIPVLGHIGLLPQKVVGEGGYRVYGRSDEEAESLLEDARALEAAGAFGIVVECVPAAVAERITQAVRVPTIGIGAGPGCSGQVQVVHDILGLFDAFKPKHARRYGNLSEEIRRIIGQYRDDVSSGDFPGPENSW